MRGETGRETQRSDSPARLPSFAREGARPCLRWRRGPGRSRGGAPPLHPLGTDSPVAPDHRLSRTLRRGTDFSLVDRQGREDLGRDQLRRLGDVEHVACLAHGRPPGRVPLPAHLGAAAHLEEAALRRPPRPLPLQQSPDPPPAPLERASPRSRYGRGRSRPPRPPPGADGPRGAPSSSPACPRPEPPPAGERRPASARPGPGPEPSGPTAPAAPPGRRTAARSRCAPTTPQFWVEKDRLLCGGSASRRPSGVFDVEMGGFEPLGEGWTHPARSEEERHSRAAGGPCPPVRDRRTF